MARTTTQKIRVIREIAGEYVRAGETYTVTRRESGRGLKADAHFYNEARKCGTYMRDWQVTASLLTGALVVI